MCGVPIRQPAHTRPRCSCQHHTLRVRVAASSVEMAAKKRPKKKPVKKQVRYLGLPSPPPSSPIPRPTSSTPSHDVFIAPRPPPPPPQAASDDGDLFVHEGTKGFTGDPNAFVYRVGLSE